MMFISTTLILIDGIGCLIKEKKLHVHVQDTQQLSNWMKLMVIACMFLEAKTMITISSMTPGNSISDL